MGTPRNPPPASARETASRECTDLNAWTLARHGMPLDLANFGDFMLRVAGHEQVVVTERRRAQT